MENPSMEQLAEHTRETPTAELRTSPPHHKVSRKTPVSFPTPDYSKVESRVQFFKGQYKRPKSQSKAPLSFPTPDYSQVKSRVQFFKGQYKRPESQSKTPVSFPTPDYSQVKSRVQFFKGQYKPPKSRRTLREDSLSPQAPLPFKSSADLVRDVLQHTADGSSSSNICRLQQAITFVDQLQEIYMQLLNKHAEAENTINHLRLTAKENLTHSV
ncbi:AT-hook-containing transcription factor-like [Gouania willdenowi]|uniref:AT-hook-containing transcription factor-like n=1 Tax=Gouania willdenowi TaxID=441366 RepID=UPI001054C978|nr:AT-hook-containing transcription factor-like [Gouania willdenowi]XP_028327328.1 AT-hook-containing transcription factor-like [Gouania willdenowi]